MKAFFEMLAESGQDLEALTSALGEITPEVWDGIMSAMPVERADNEGVIAACRSGELRREEHDGAYRIRFVSEDYDPDDYAFNDTFIVEADGSVIYADDERYEA